MKKHILGLALFSLIVASFALIYAYFYAPSIPPKEAVRPPASQAETRTERPYFCPSRKKDFSYEIVSANYFAEQNKLITKVKLYWNGNGEAPKKIAALPRIFTVDNYDKALPLKTEILVNPFENGNGKTFTFESKFILSEKGNGPPNLYIAFDFSDSETGNYLMTEKSGLAEAFHILYVYGERSFYRPGAVNEGRFDPNR